MAKKAPKYFGFRMFLTSNLLYTFLVIPFMIVTLAQKAPDVLRDKGLLDNDSTSISDSLQVIADSLNINQEFLVDSLVGDAVALGKKQQADMIDSLVSDAVALGMEMEKQLEKAGEDSVSNRSVTYIGPHLKVDPGDDNGQSFEEKGPMNRLFIWLFFLSLCSYLAGYLYNFRIRRYFLRQRKGRDPSEKERAHTRRHLLHTPLINALIVSLPSAIIMIRAFLYILFPNEASGELELETLREYCLLATLATLLEFLFMFYWQKHRVQILYLEHVFSPEELRERIRPRRGEKIRQRLVIASMMTTFLPLLIVMAYLVQGITRFSTMDLENISQEAWEILMGPWGSLIGESEKLVSVGNEQWIPYVNAVDSISMIVGIGAGIMVSLLYLMLFIRWTNQDLSIPLKELLEQMRNTRGGEAEQYTLVRTNDEIGELAEGYNEMTHKIHEHMDHIFTLNRDLEMKVEERTQEVVSQKEEIEAQKEEILTQLDMVTAQRDTISRQKDQIMDSIQYAEKIQSALLPPSVNLKEVLKDHFILFKPRDIVSGDYYWSAFKEGKLMVAAADCTGHGVPGAFLSVLGISSLNELVNRSVGVPSASQMLENLRDYVIHSLHQTGERGEANDGIEIAFCILDPVNKELEFAGANRPMYVSRKDKGSGEVDIRVIKGDRIPIGIYGEGSAPFTSSRISLEDGDCVYLFSDGYADQLGGPRRKTFRVVHFREILAGMYDLDMDEQKKILLEKHLEWSSGVEQIDDILVLGMRI